MSADNWAQCPICHNLPDEWRNGIEHLYGVVSEQEYTEIKSKCQTRKDQECVREDYEIGIDTDGMAYVNYGAECQNCGAEWVIKQNGIKRRK